jgi:hypothetical protein
MKVEVGSVYRHRDNPNIGYAKVLEVMPAESGINKNGHKVVKVEWSQRPDFTFGLIKYFKQSDMVKERQS